MGPGVNVLTVTIISIGTQAIQRRLMRNNLEMRGLHQETERVEFKGEYEISCNINDVDCERNFSKQVAVDTSSSPTTSPTVRCVPIIMDFSFILTPLHLNSLHHTFVNTDLSHGKSHDISHKQAFNGSIRSPLYFWCTFHLSNPQWAAHWKSICVCVTDKLSK